MPDKKENKNTEQKEFDDILFNLLQQEGFRDYVWQLLEWGHMFQTTFTGNSGSYFHEGERNFALKILAQINESDPEAFLKMMRKSSLKHVNNKE